MIPRLPVLIFELLNQESLNLLKKGLTTYTAIKPQSITKPH